MLGTYVLSAGYYDAYYLQALKVRRLIRADFAPHSKGRRAPEPDLAHAAFKLGAKTRTRSRCT